MVNKNIFILAALLLVSFGFATNYTQKTPIDHAQGTVADFIGVVFTINNTGDTIVRADFWNSSDSATNCILYQGNGNYSGYTPLINATRTADRCEFVSPPLNASQNYTIGEWATGSYNFGYNGTPTYPFFNSRSTIIAGWIAASGSLSAAAWGLANFTITAGAGSSYINHSYINFSTPETVLFNYNMSIEFDDNLTNKGITANLTYNGTFYNSSIANASKLYATITPPPVLTPTNITLTWNYTYNGTAYTNTTTVLVNPPNTLNNFSTPETVFFDYNITLDFATDISNRNISANLTYNGTIYPAIVFNGSRFYATITPPAILIPTNITAVWNYTYNGTKYSNSSVVLANPPNTLNGFTNPEYTINNYNITLDFATDISNRNLSVNLTYNGTLYTPTALNGSRYYATITPPSITSQINVSVVWNYTYNGTKYSNSSLVLVIPTNITLCTSGGNPLFIFSFFDQAFPTTPVNSTMDSTFTIKSGLNTINASFNASTPAINFSVCTNLDNGTSVFVDSIQAYTATGYRNLFYYLQNYSATVGAYSNISLYNLNSTGSVLSKYTILSGSNTPVVGAYLQIQRYYPATNQLLTVSMGKTDSNGFAESYIVPNTIIYRYLVSENYALIFTSDSATLPCDSAATLCQYSIYVSSSLPNEYSGYIDDTLFGCGYTNATETVYCTSNNPSGTGTDIRLRVWEIGSYANVLVCDNVINTGSGTVACTLNNTATKQYYYVGTATVGSIITVGNDYIGMQANRNFPRNDGVIATIGVILVFATLGMMGGFSATIIMACLGLILSALIGFVDITAAAVGGIVMMGIIIAWVLRG